MIGGDIHCGVISRIKNNETNMTIEHYTTSPITNHVCKFFPELEGSVNSR